MHIKIQKAKMNNLAFTCAKDEYDSMTSPNEVKKTLYSRSS